MPLIFSLAFYLISSHQPINKKPHQIQTNLKNEKFCNRHDATFFFPCENNGPSRPRLSTQTRTTMRSKINQTKWSERRKKTNKSARRSLAFNKIVHCLFGEMEVNWIAWAATTAYTSRIQSVECSNQSHRSIGFSATRIRVSLATACAPLVVQTDKQSMDLWCALLTRVRKILFILARRARLRAIFFTFSICLGCAEWRCRGPRLFPPRRRKFSLRFVFALDYFAGAQVIYCYLETITFWRLTHNTRNGYWTNKKKLNTSLFIGFGMGGRWVWICWVMNNRFDFAGREIS